MAEALKYSVENEPDYAKSAFVATGEKLAKARISGNQETFIKTVSGVFHRGENFLDTVDGKNSKRLININSRENKGTEDKNKDIDGVSEEAKKQSHINLANLSAVVKDGYLQDFINSDSVSLEEKKEALGIKGEATQEQLESIILFIKHICLHMFDDEYRHAKNYILMVGFIYRLLRNPAWPTIGKGGDDELTSFENQYYDDAKSNPAFADWYFKALVGAAEENKNKTIFGVGTDILRHRFVYVKNKMAIRLGLNNKVDPKVQEEHELLKKKRNPNVQTRSNQHVQDDLSLASDPNQLARSKFAPDKAESFYDLDTKNMKDLQRDMFEDIKASGSSLGIDNTKVYSHKDAALLDEDCPDYLLESRDTNGKYRIDKIQKRLMRAREEATTPKQLAALADLEQAVFASHMIESMGTAQSFTELYHAYYNYFKSSYDPNDLNLSKISPSRKINANQYAAIMTTKQMKSSMGYLNGLIFRPAIIYAEQPTEEFSHAISHGASNINPAQKYNKLHNLLLNLKGRINDFEAAKKSQAPHAPGTNTDSDTHGHGAHDDETLFCVTELGAYERTHDPGLSRDVDKYISATEYSFEHTSAYSLVNELSNYLDTRKELISIGWNMQYISSTNWQDKKGYFDSVSAIAEMLRSNVLDRGNNMEDSALLEEVKSFAEQTLNQMFGEQNWSNLDRITRIQKMNQYSVRTNLGVQLKYFMEEYYPEVSEKRRNEIISLGLAYLYGVRFREATHSSYLEPPETFGGQGADIYAKAAVFDEWYNFRRWAMGANKPGHDFAFKGAALCPADMMRLRERLEQLKEHLNPMDYIEEGWKIYKDTKKNGRLAYMLSNHYVNIRYDAAGNEQIVENMSHVSQKKNKFGQGGVEIIGSSWRNKSYLRANIPSKYLKDSLGGGNVNINLAGQPDAYVAIWKSVENIGINEIKAFSDDFAGVDAVQDKNGTIILDGDKGVATGQLVKFLYERYFKDSSVGSSLYQDTTYVDGEDFFKKEVLDKLKDHKKLMDNERKSRGGMRLNLNVESDKKAFSTYVSNNLLKPLIYQAMTVATIERTPLELIYNTLKRDEQNGVSLVDQLKDSPGMYFDTTSDLYKSMMISGSHGHTQDHVDTKEAAWNSMVNDLKFVQARLRGNIDEDIAANRKSWSENESMHPSNIYGNYTNLYSQVNGGKGYRLDDDTIGFILYRQSNPMATEKEYKEIKPDNPSYSRIQRAIIFNQQICKAAREQNVKSKYEESIEHYINTILPMNGGKSLTKDQWNAQKDNADEKTKSVLALLEGEFGPPEDSEDDHAIEGQKRLVKHYRLYEKRKQSRAKWFAHLWQEGHLGGRSFMADHSDKYILFSNTDQRVVARAAGDCYDASERLKTYRGDVFAEGSMLTMIKDAVRKGEDSWGTLKSLMTLNRKEFSNANGDPSTFMPIIDADWSIIFTMLSKNHRARTFMGEYASWMNPTNNSIAGEAWTFWESHDFSAVNVKQFLYAMTKVGGMNPDAADYFSKAFYSTWGEVAKELLPHGFMYLLTYAFVTWGVNGLNKLEKG